MTGVPERDGSDCVVVGQHGDHDVGLPHGVGDGLRLPGTSGHELAGLALRAIPDRYPVAALEQPGS
jgi:hypothetical protein